MYEEGVPHFYLMNVIQWDANAFKERVGRSSVAGSHPSADKVLIV